MELPPLPTQHRTERHASLTYSDPGGSHEVDTADVSAPARAASVPLFTADEQERRDPGGARRQADPTAEPTDDDLAQKKLFIGHIPSGIRNRDLMGVCRRYGTVDSLFYMHDEHGGERGWAFVEYRHADEAHAAITNLDGRQTFRGASQPVEVRYAQSIRRAQFVPTVSEGEAEQPLTQPADEPTGQAGGRQQQMLVLEEQEAEEASPSYPVVYPPPPYGSDVPSELLGQPSAPEGRPPLWIRYETSEGVPYYFNTLSRMSQWDRPADFDAQSPPYVTGDDSTSDRPPSVGSSEAELPMGAHGPLGANLFVFHLPNEWRDYDLFTHFKSFGRVISARVQTDKDSGRSRGYGFVCYDHPDGARAAIKTMNGFSVGGKRLKVTVKKGEEQYLNAAVEAGTTPASLSPSASQAQAQATPPPSYEGGGTQQPFPHPPPAAEQSAPFFPPYPLMEGGYVGPSPQALPPHPFTQHQQQHQHQHQQHQAAPLQTGTPQQHYQRHQQQQQQQHYGHGQPYGQHYGQHYGQYFGQH